MKTTRMLLAALLILVVAMPAGAYPNLFDSRCMGCHSDDTPTCNGCHEHRGSLSAFTSADVYAPGDPLSITLDGGQQYGWIRAILYDDANVVQAIATGPTGTGDDGGTDDIEFPTTLNATAPGVNGTYVWQAAWFGGNTSGSGHLENRVNVTVFVDDTNTSIPTIRGVEHLDALSAIKALY